MSLPLKYRSLYIYASETQGILQSRSASGVAVCHPSALLFHHLLPYAVFFCPTLTCYMYMYTPGATRVVESSDRVLDLRASSRSRRRSRFRALESLIYFCQRLSRSLTPFYRERARSRTPATWNPALRERMREKEEGERESCW